MAANQDGKWRPPAAVPFKTAKLADELKTHSVTDDRGQFVIHAIHLRSGKVLWFSGHAEDLLYPQTTYLFDPKKPSDVVEKKVPAGIDLVLLPLRAAAGRQRARCRRLTDGSPQRDRLLTPIATTAVAPALRPLRCSRPNPGKEAWRKLGSLKQGRWYPTAVTLGDGSVLVISGRREALDVRGL